MIGLVILMLPITLAATAATDTKPCLVPDDPYKAGYETPVNRAPLKYLIRYCSDHFDCNKTGKIVQAEYNKTLEIDFKLNDVPMTVRWYADSYWVCFGYLELRQQEDKSFKRACATDCMKDRRSSSFLSWFIYV